MSRKSEKWWVCKGACEENGRYDVCRCVKTARHVPVDNRVKKSRVTRGRARSSARSERAGSAAQGYV